MHQQVRVLIRKAMTDGLGAKHDEESLVEILTLLKGKNLRSAGRIDPTGGGEFVFSVHHAKGDDTADEEARDILRDMDYQADVYQVRPFVLDDREGTLLECIERIEAELQEPVIEVHVLTAEKNRKVPVQLVTRSMLDR